VWFPVNLLLARRAAGTYGDYFGEGVASCSGWADRIDHRLFRPFRPGTVTGAAVGRSDLSVPLWRRTRRSASNFNGDKPARDSGRSPQTGWTALVVAHLSLREPRYGW